MSVIAVILTLSLKNRPTSVNTNRKAHKASLPLCATTTTKKPKASTLSLWTLSLRPGGSRNHCQVSTVKRGLGKRGFGEGETSKVNTGLTVKGGKGVGGRHLGWRRAGTMRDNGSRYRSCTPANGMQFVVPSARVCATVAVSCAGSALLERK